MNNNIPIQCTYVATPSQVIMEYRATISLSLVKKKKNSKSEHSREYLDVTPLKSTWKQVFYQKPIRQKYSWTEWTEVMNTTDATYFQRRCTEKQEMCGFMLIITPGRWGACSLCPEVELRHQPGRTKLWRNICVLLGSVVPLPAAYLPRSLSLSSVGKAGGAAPVETDWCFLNQVHPSPFPHTLQSQPLSHTGGRCIWAHTARIADILLTPLCWAWGSQPIRGWVSKNMTPSVPLSATADQPRVTSSLQQPALAGRVPSR